MNKFYEINPSEDLITKKLAGELSETEAQIFEEWLQADKENQKLYQEMLFVWKESEQVNQKFEKEIQLDHAWNQLSAKLGIDNNKVIKLNFWERYQKFTFLAVAVLFLGILSYALVLPKLMENQQPAIKWLAVENTMDSPKTVQMPDGSTIVLNENTKLEYPDKFNNRIVKLEGEAFFEVEHLGNQPFKVMFGEGQDQEVEVLGTSFNIRAYKNDDRQEVSVLSGKVRFKTSTKQQLLLAGEAAHYFPTVDQIHLQTANNAISWKSQVLEFKNQDLGSIVRDLERHYQQTIILDDPRLKNCLFKGIFKEADLDAVLKAIAFGLELEIEKTQKGYILKGDPCNE